MRRAGTSVVMMNVWIIAAVLLFINATSCLAVGVSAIQVRETTQYSADIELVDKTLGLFVSFVKCNGTQTYITENKIVVDREKSQVKESFPDGNDRVWISNLIPNCNYTCVVVQKNDMDHRSLSFGTFSTKYADPVPPAAPELTTETNNGHLVVTILLFRSSTKPSPISGYILQFYVVEVDADGKAVFSPDKPLELIPSLENARSSDTPIDFLYQTYDASSLPDTVIVQPSVLLGAFKHNYTYSAVLTAYRNASEGHEYDYATSKPSAAFKIMYSAVDKYNFRSKYARNVAGIVLGGVVPVLLCISAIALVTLWCKYRKKSTNSRYQKKYQKNKFNYPVFDADRRSVYSMKSLSPQYQPKKDPLPNQPTEQPGNRMSNVLKDKGMDMLRRTSITVANAYKDFRSSLKRYSWVGEVDDLIIVDGDKDKFTESEEFLDASEVAETINSADLLDLDDSGKSTASIDVKESIEDYLLDLEDPGIVTASVDAKENAGSIGDIQDINDGQNFEDPERIMGSVITLSSTPQSKSASGDQLTDVFTEQPQDEPTDVFTEQPQDEPLQEVLEYCNKLF